MAGVDFTHHSIRGLFEDVLQKNDNNKVIKLNERVTHRLNKEVQHSYH